MNATGGMDPITYGSTNQDRFSIPCGQSHSTMALGTRLVSPGTSRTGTPQILVFSGSKRALLQSKNADYALIFTEEWRRVDEQKILDFTFVLKGIYADLLMELYIYWGFIFRYIVNIRQNTTIFRSRITCINFHI